MALISVKEISNKREMQDFIRVVDSIYRDCPQYVPDLEKDIYELFDPKKNSGLAFTDIKAWVAYIGNKPVGRIVGLINHRANERWDTKAARFSMIEFIDDKEVPAALLDTVAQWGAEKGMNRLQGPMGITDFDKEGMLVEDFDLASSTNTIYNHDYYPRHLEALGFQKEVDWIQIRIDIPQKVPDRYARTAQYVKEEMGMRVVKLTNREIAKGGYGRQMFQLLNEAYQPIFGFCELTSEQIDEFVEKYLKLIDLQLIPVVFDEKGDMVGVAVTMGSLTQAMQRSHGRLWPLGWWHLLKSRFLQHEDHADMLLVAVRPDYQGMGVNALFFDDLIPIYNKYGFRWAETGPQLEDNMRELTQWKPLKPKTVKRRRCYYKTIA